AAGVPVRVIPGVTSAVAAPALAGIPLTERGLVHDFTVVSGHLAPGDPDSLVNWRAVAASRGTLVLLMAVRQLPRIARTLVAFACDPDAPVAAIMDAASQRQRVARGELSRVEELDVTAPAVIVIGRVARRA